MTLSLHEKGVFTWTEWAAALTVERGSVNDYGGADYYQSWLAALEALVLNKRLAEKSELECRARDWRWAYQVTPHGVAVTLGVGR